MIALLDTLFRFGAVGVLAVGAAILLIRAPRLLPARLVAAFSVCVAAYLVYASAEARQQLGPLGPPLHAAAIAAPGLLWLAVLALFRDGFRPGPLHFLPLAALEIAGFAAPGLLHHLVAVGLYVAAAATAWQGYGADLIEPRRRFRLWFVGCTSALGLVIAVSELALGDVQPPAWLELLGAAAIGLVSGALLVWALELKPSWFAAGGLRPVPAAAGDETSPAERQLLAELRAAMEVRKAYRREGLTIAALASDLRVPEHALRKAINQRLGYRNFNAFLNRYRIEEVKAALRDPGKARLPILTLALEAGYGSIGPFNRAFRDACGMTPTEFREAGAGNAAPISESAMDREV